MSHSATIPNQNNQSSGCTLYETCNIAYHSNQGETICLFCFEYCNNSFEKYTVKTNTKEICSCSHEENSDFFKIILTNMFKNFSSFTISQISASNFFLSHKLNDKSVIELCNPGIIDCFSSDYQALVNNNFRWEDIEISSIEERASFVNIFIQTDLKIKLAILNTGPLEQLFPLKFIDSITNVPDYSFGQPIYNQSLNFYSYLLEYFFRYYLLKDFFFLNKIDAQDIETYSPLSRKLIREQNQNNLFIKQKYFNEQFNLHKFAIKLVEKFVPGATWRWIGGNHKAHVICIKIIKILIEYGFLNEIQCEEVKQILYSKIQVYKSLEIIIDRDSNSGISEFWVNIWIDGLKLVREFYAEILIHIIFLKKDNELYSIIDTNEDLNKLDFEKCSLVFKNSFFFHEDFSRKMMEFFHGYILTQNKINNKVLSSLKLDNISDNFLQNISNIDDHFLKSLKLMTSDCYSRLKNSKIVIKEVTNIQKEIYKIYNDIILGLYCNNESKLIIDLIKILDRIENIILKCDNSYNLQISLLNCNIPFMIEIIIGNYSANIPRFEYNELFDKFGNLLVFYLKDNYSIHSIFFIEQNFWNFENILDVFPEKMTEILYNIFSSSTLVLIYKEYILDVLLGIFQRMSENLTNEQDELLKIKSYKYMSNLLNIISLYLDKKQLKKFNWIYEYDIRITMDLVNYENFLDLEKIKNIMIDNNDFTNPELIFLMNYLKILAKSTKNRFVDSSYKKLNEKFKLKNLYEMMNLSDKNIDFKIIIMQLYANIHIDFKDNLINNRSEYYYTKPSDMQYEEDPFVDKDYNITIDLFIEQISYIEKLWINKDEMFFKNIKVFTDFLINSILTNIIKLMNYFLILKESFLIKLQKYIKKLEELLNFLNDKRLFIIKIIGDGFEEKISPTKRKLELQLAKFDNSFQLKKDKIMIISYSENILEICKNLIGNMYLNENKCIIIKKDPIKLSNKLLEKSKMNSNFKKDHIDYLILLKNKLKKCNQINNYIEIIYQIEKIKKITMNSEINYYLDSYNESKEMESLAHNYCNFVYNQIKSEWNIDKKSTKFSIIQSLSNSLFHSSRIIQEGLINNIKYDTDNFFMDRIWNEMKWSLSLVKFKTNLDIFWKETFLKTMLLARIHHAFCQENNIEFKEIFRLKILPNDTIDRVQRWTTVFQRISDNCEWHYGYLKGEISVFQKQHRPYLFGLATLFFENLSELCMGPNKENQKKVYTFIYDRYNGILKRFWIDENSEFYKLKLALINFMLVGLEGLDPDIVNYQTTNFELSNINMIMTNSMKLLKNLIIGKNRNIKKMNDIELKFNDYLVLFNCFLKSDFFRKHPLFLICIKLFEYVKKLAEVKTKYNIFLKEREELLSLYENEKIIKNTVEESDLVTFKILNNILSKIEVISENNIVNFYFYKTPFNYFLSKETKRNFEEKLSWEKKKNLPEIIGKNLNLFKLEMNYNLNNRFENKDHLNLLQNISICLSILGNIIYYIKGNMIYLRYDLFIILIISIFGLLSYFINKISLFRIKFSEKKKIEKSVKNLNTLDKMFVLNEILFNCIFNLKILLWNIISVLLFLFGFEDFLFMNLLSLLFYIPLLSDLFTMNRGIIIFTNYFLYLCVIFIFYPIESCLKIMIIYLIFLILIRNNKKKEIVINETCLICLYNKSDYSNKNLDFKAHIKNEHNLWNYIYFLIQLQEKTKKECNGIELNLWKGLKNGKLDFLPIKRSISFESANKHIN